MITETTNSTADGRIWAIGHSLYPTDAVAQQWGQVGNALLGAGLGSSSARFIQAFKKRGFKQKFNRNMPKNAYVLRKKTVKSPQRWGLHLQTSRAVTPAYTVKIFGAVASIP